MVWRLKQSQHTKRRSMQYLQLLDRTAITMHQNHILHHLSTRCGLTATHRFIRYPTQVFFRKTKKSNGLWTTSKSLSSHARTPHHTRRITSRITHHHPTKSRNSLLRSFYTTPHRHIFLHSSNSQCFSPNADPKIKLEVSSELMLPSSWTLA